MAKLTLFAASLVAVLALAAAVWLSTDGPDTPSSPGALPQNFIAGIGPGQQLCIADQIIPPGTARIEMTLSTYGRPLMAAIAVTGRAGDKLVLAGSRRFREAQNVVVPVAPTANREQLATICLSNIGHAEFQIAGSSTSGPSLRHPGATQFSWTDIAGDIGERFQRVRVAPFGAATAWLALALALAAIALGVGTVIRTARR